MRSRGKPLPQPFPRSVHPERRGESGSPSGFPLGSIGRGLGGYIPANLRTHTPIYRHYRAL
jgi:hypothetical protein